MSWTFGKISPLWLSLGIVFNSMQARASLGEHFSSVQTNGRDIHAKVSKLSEQSFYDVYAMTTEMGEVKQYIDGHGIVFAVTWHGINHPDLSKLLGTFFEDYAAADEAVLANRGDPQKKISTEQMTVEKSGHMGAVQGKAYLPSLVPVGVRLENLN